MSTSYGILKDGQAAERERGLRLLETFKSIGEVQKNGGTINGTVSISNNSATFTTSKTDYIEYPIGNINIKDTKGSLRCIAETSGAVNNRQYIMFNIGGDNTGIFKFYFQGNGSNLRLVIIIGDGAGTINQLTTSYTYNINTKYEAVLTSDGSAYKIYLDGSDITPDFSVDAGSNNGRWLGDDTITNPKVYIGAQEYNGSIVSGFEGKIYGYVQYFSETLSAQDAINYYNNSTFNYLNRADFNAPCNLANDDPANNKALDVSGNGNDIEFGTGSATPTKRTDSKGYFYDGVNDYGEITNLSLDSASEDFTVAISFKKTNVEEYAIAQSHSLGSYSSDWIILGAAASIFWMRSTVLGDSNTVDDNNWHRAVFVWDLSEEKYKGYVDGEYIGQSAKVSGYGGVGTIKLGTRGDAASSFYFGSSSNIIISKGERWTPMQVKDDYLRIMKSINNM